jgi:hypothetical protein
MSPLGTGLVMDTDTEETELCPAEKNGGGGPAAKTRGGGLDMMSIFCVRLVGKNVV